MDYFNKEVIGSEFVKEICLMEFGEGYFISVIIEKIKRICND